MVCIVILLNDNFRIFYFQTVAIETVLSGPV